MIIISREVAKGEDFLSLSSEDLVKLISSNDLAVPFEEKVSKLQIVFLIFCMENQQIKVCKYTVQLMCRFYRDHCIRCVIFEFNDIKSL